MKSLTRRSLLRDGAISVAALAPTIPALAAPIHKENTELLALGEQINPLLATYRAALARHTDARATAEANCPPVPDEIVCKGLQWRGCTEYEADVEGKDIWPPDYVGADGKTYTPMPRNVLNSGLAKSAIERGDFYTTFGKQLRQRIRTAERYEAEREVAIERSGVRVAADELGLAATDIDVLAWKIRDFAPVTMAGVQILARALAAHGETERHGAGFTGRAGLTLGRQLADAVLRVEGELRGES